MPTTHPSPIRIGLCALDRKVHSKAMDEILHYLAALGSYEFVYFGEACIGTSPIEEWPLCDVLIAFYSAGLPLERVLQYVNLRNPLCINDVRKQFLLMNRATVYEVLDAHAVRVPPHAVVDWTNESLPASDLVVPFERPFVEKPLDSEDHTVNVYYPSSGVRHLFRKTKSRSSVLEPSEFDPRHDRPYLYEPFLEPQGFWDIKVYMVGPYFFSEARQAPTKDGIVERDEFGKEKRFEMALTEEEMKFGQVIYDAFGQFVCGFDILRHGGKSYICDVNGWSFVKNAPQYSQNCAHELNEFIQAQLPVHLNQA